MVTATRSARGLRIHRRRQATPKRRRETRLPPPPAAATLSIPETDGILRLNVNGEASIRPPPGCGPRCKQPGMRWSLANVPSVLSLRALLLSGRPHRDAFWATAPQTRRPSVTALTRSHEAEA